MKNMSYEEFKKNLLRMLRKRLRDSIKSEIIPANKNNGILKETVGIENGIDGLKPIVYVESLYDQYCMGADLSTCVSFVIGLYREIPDLHMEQYFESWEAVKPKIIVRVVNWEWNKDELRDIPYKKYLDLASDILKSNLMYKRECISSLLSSLFYLDGGVIEKRMKDAQARKDVSKLDRSKVIFDRFISVVSEYHTQERGVAFYADKLCLTPKYLSKLVKSASGRSAPDWIDAYVMLEAKNMLKYSDIPIKEIVSRLNFPNPSTFHKFFKAKAGLTPLQYRKM